MSKQIQYESLRLNSYKLNKIKLEFLLSTVTLKHSSQSPFLRYFTDNLNS